jgi:flagellar protein FliL
MAANPAAKPSPGAAASAASAPAPEPKKRRSWLKIMILLVLSLGAGGGAAWYFLQKPATGEKGGAAGAAAAKTEKKPPAQYMALEPAFVVNLADEGSTRYLQTELQVMSRDPKAIADLNTHMPAVRNALLMLFSKQKQADVRSEEGRRKLQADALAEINRVLREETGKGDIEALFFTSLVTQ